MAHDKSHSHNDPPIGCIKGNIIPHHISRIRVSEQNHAVVMQPCTHTKTNNRSCAFSYSTGLKDPCRVILSTWCMIPPIEGQGSHRSSSRKFWSRNYNRHQDCTRSSYSRRRNISNRSKRNNRRDTSYRSAKWREISRKHRDISESADYERTYRHRRTKYRNRRESHRSRS